MVPPDLWPMWDGLKELGNPAPRWWLIVWIISILFAVGYWIVFPAWPTPAGHTKGVAGWTEYSKLKAEQKEIDQRQGTYLSKLHTMSFDQIRADPAEYAFAKAGGALRHERKGHDGAGLGPAGGLLGRAHHELAP